MEVIQLSDVAPRRQVVAAVTFNNGVPGRSFRENSIHHYFDGYTWAWRERGSYYLEEPYTTLIEFSDGTFGMCRPEFAEQAIARVS